METLREDLASFASKLEAEWTLRERTTRPRAAVLVSREGHCLADLLWRWRSGDLDMDLVGVIGNHRDLELVARREGVPFVHLPMEPGDRATAFAAIERQLNEWRTEVAVLARFMQIVPPDLCARWAGRMINIHHSFLPAFAGAQPYRQAHQRGVKLIGATCHYVTAELRCRSDHRPGGHAREHFHSMPDLVRPDKTAERLASSAACVTTSKSASSSTASAPWFSATDFPSPKPQHPPTHP